MGQKVNPHGLRVGVIKDWDSRWFARDNAFGDILVEDYNLRKFLKKKLYDAGVPKIEIERTADKVRINIHCARPGIVIGKGGAEIEKLRAECEALVNKGKTQKLTVLPLGVIEVKSPDKNAQLVAENIAAQLEGRVSFRRAMKQAIGRAMKPMGREPGAKGIKTQCSGRLGGAEIARVEQYHEGTIPLQRLPPPTAASALRFGSMPVRCCRTVSPRRKEAASNAVAQKSKISSRSARSSDR